MHCTCRGGSSWFRGMEVSETKKTTVIGLEPGWQPCGAVILACFFSHVRLPPLSSFWLLWCSRTSEKLVKKLKTISQRFLFVLRVLESVVVQDTKVAPSMVPIEAWYYNANEDPPSSEHKFIPNRKVSVEHLNGMWLFGHDESSLLRRRLAEQLVGLR